MRKSPMPDTRNLLDLCYRIEMKAAEFYRALARAHAAHPKMVALWTKTAAEEDNHALQFKLSPRALEAMVERVTTDEADAQQALRLGETLLEDLLHSTPPVAEALRTAIQLETYLARFHMNNAVTFKNDLYRKLFDSMMRADQKHLESLQAALDELEGRS